VIGQVLSRTGLRKDVYLVTKNQAYRRAQGGTIARVLEDGLNASMERLQTDYIDAYYLHGIAGNQIALLRDPAVKAAFEALKKSGKIRYCGLSCHDALLPELLQAAAEGGWIDQVMIKFNFRDVGGRDRYDDLNRAIDAASKANLGLVAMKTQGGAGNFPEKMKQLQEKGFKKEVAAIKTVWADGRMHVAVSEMTTRSDLRENVQGSQEELTAKEARLLEEHRRATARLYCHGCGHLCETAANGVPVATVLRALRY
jgi:predicted aldo/keto reductase-like oxidoreductase